MDLLPPGVGFFPSQELLVNYYLANKNNEALVAFNGSDLIKELNLYAYDPFELPYTSSHIVHLPKQFYCFTEKVDEERRSCKTGFWMKKGKIQEITGAGDVVLGTKTLFIFYLGNSPNSATRTDWIMYEYTLANKPLAPFVVCRVFDCPPDKDLDSEFGAISDIVEGDADGDDKMNEVTQKLKGTAAADLDDAFAGLDGNQLEKFAELIDDDDFLIEDMTPEQLERAILEEDYIERDDFA